jgi:phosphate transport system permease protein
LVEEEALESGAETLDTKVLKEKLIKNFLLVGAVSSIGIVFFIMAIIVYVGYPQIFDWLTHGFGMKWLTDYGDAGEYGITPFIFSTVYVGVGAIALATAIGIPCGIYLAEFANSKIRNIIKPSLEMLTGFPSVIIGLIGFTLVVGLLVRYTGQTSVSVVAGWIVLAIMALPTIATITEDAVRRVPNELREASLGIGATKWQTTVRVLIPSAKQGIIASILLGLGEAIGEVMAVYYVMLLTLPGPPITLDPFVNSSVMTSLLLKVTSNEYGTDSRWWHAIFGVAFVLFVICAVLNIMVRKITANKNDEKMKRAT